jgi:predicted HTH domain antitoxin
VNWPVLAVRADAPLGRKDGPERRAAVEITVKLPDDIAQHENPGREALEAMAIEGYSSGALTAYQARMLLGIDNRFDFDGFLKERNVEAGAYGIAEYERDLQNLSKLDEQQRKKRSA